MEPKTRPSSDSGTADKEAAAVYAAGTKPLRQLRNSERHDFKRCPLRWSWRYRDQLVPVQFTTGPLLFGSLGHLCLADWYVPGTTRGVDPVETWDRITEELWDAVKVESYVDDEVEGTWVDARQLGREMLTYYREHYGDDEHLEVLAVEDQFKQLIPHPMALRRKAAGKRSMPQYQQPVVEYVGTIDLIVRNHVTGLIEYMDHKFMKTIETDHLYIDDQNGGYLAIGTHELRKRGLIGPKEAVRVLVYNFLRKAKHDTRPMNAAGKYTNQPVSKHYIDAIYRHVVSLGRGDESSYADLAKALQGYKKAELVDYAAQLGLTVLGEVSATQPPPYFHRERIERTGAERNRQIARIGEEAIVMQQFRDGKLPIFKNPTRDCKWDCSFFDLCNIDESGGDVEFAKKQMFKREDPYGEYEAGALSPKLLQDRR